MRISTTGLLAAAVVVGGGAMGCVTETRIREPGLIVSGTQPPPDPEQSSEAKRARAREWVEQLELKGVPPRSQAGKTLYLVRRLRENFPFATEVILEMGINHASAKVRENCAFVLGYTRDKKAEEALMRALDDEAERVRLSAAASLVTGFRNSAGVPPLLRALYHKSPHVRRQAIYNLRIFTQQFYNYQWDAPPSEREFAAGKWEDWWRRKGATFVPPVRGMPNG